jgi:hypothetical protein
VAFDGLGTAEPDALHSFNSRLFASIRGLKFTLQFGVTTEKTHGHRRPFAPFLVTIPFFLPLSRRFPAVVFARE